jgi:hypothetical protein
MARLLTATTHDMFVSVIGNSCQRQRPCRRTNVTTIFFSFSFFESGRFPRGLEKWESGVAPPEKQQLEDWGELDPLNTEYSVTPQQR